MATTNQPKLQPIFFILSHLFSFLTNKKFKMNMICNIKFKKKKKKKKLNMTLQVSIATIEWAFWTI